MNATGSLTTRDRGGQPLCEPMLPIAYRVKSFQAETHDVFTINLVPSDVSTKIPRFFPGQFNMIYAFGAGEVPISISGDPGRAGDCIHTIRAVGQTTALLQKLKPGAEVGIRGPYGRPWPVDKAQGKDLVLIAGGIGLAPLRPALYHALGNRLQYGRIILLFGTRTPRDILFANELAEWARRKDMQILITVDAGDANWNGRVGVVPKLISEARFDPLHSVAMICGPEIMMRYTIPELTGLGMPDDRIFVTMERSMKCGIGFCGHCQYGGVFVCKDGPVFSYNEVEAVFLRKEF
ncbi:MAG: Ni/Fe hydrogenase subunit gamma [Bdellovibrionales bacterium RIFOXYC1_FULL_54_43]|nr:MAG: Ni/Fe hydrogenase subunit gamma [Bdellovibrionales bacterium RIFOXYC1_FULL_54_43]OFZ81462.1 MAG: Ni/Fe hydrogenase subunit gamma [Bdellovibrionales bacterium RIFOXYD1_FULL_55_31]